MEGLQDQTPAHQPLIGIVHAIKEFQWVMIGVDENRVGRPTQIDLERLEG